METQTAEAPATEQDDLSRTMGLVRRIEVNPEGRAALEYRAGLHMCHSGGVVQGGFITGWLDAAMAHAAMAMTGFEMTPMSLELKVSFFKPTRPGLVVAEAWVERRGGSTNFMEARLLDPAGEVLAKASSTIRMVPRHKVEAASKAAAQA